MKLETTIRIAVCLLVFILLIFVGIYVTIDFYKELSVFCNETNWTGTWSNNHATINCSEVYLVETVNIKS